MDALPASTRLHARLRRCAALASGFVTALPCLVLAGWLFEIDSLKRILPGLVAMNPITAVAFIIAGAGLASKLRSQPGKLVAGLGGTAIAGVGLTVLGRYLFGWNAGIDQFLFTSQLEDNVMAPTTAVAFFLTGGSLALLDFQTRRGGTPSQCLAAVAGFAALLALTGYSYEVEKLYRFRSFIAMAMHTALTFFVLAIGLLCARPERGFMARFSSKSPGGAMLRRLLLPIVTVPFALGWLIVFGVRSGVGDAALGFALFVVAVVVFFVAMVWKNAASLDVKELERSRAEEQLRHTHEGLEATVAARTAELRQLLGVIRDGVTVLSTSAEEILGSTSELATTAAQTATSITVTTTTVEEVRQTVSASNVEAQRVATASRKTAEISRAGQAAVESTTAGMERIRAEVQSMADGMLRLSQQSRAIGEIIAAVDEISEQSSLLAVNAAIQAARAREHGKAFAVVAEEVKYLAGQSREATKQVRTILNDIQTATTAAVLATEQASKAVAAGVQTSVQAGQSIESLTVQIGDAAQVSTQIAAANKEQLLGMEQVAGAMGQIKEASAQSAGKARQLERSARSLHTLGQRLKEFADRYQ